MKRIACGLVAVSLLAGTGTPLRGDEPSVKAVIEKAIKASGGEEKLAKIKAQTWKGKGTFYGLGQPLEYTGEWFVQPPGKFKRHLEFDVNDTKIPNIRVLNGDKGWVVSMDGTKEMNADDLDDAKEEVYATWVGTLLPLRDPEFKLSALGEAKVGDRPAVGVKVSHRGHKNINLYFDKDKGLVLKSLRRVKDLMSGQEVDQETVHSEYKEFDGIQRTKKLTVKRDGKDFVDLEITEYKAQQKLDDSIFDRPKE